MAHLPRPAEIDPGLASIAQRPQAALIEARNPFEAIEPGQLVAIHPVQLTEGMAVTRDRHREGAQVMQSDPVHPGLRHETGSAEVVMVGEATLEGAVHEQQIALRLHGLQAGCTHDRRESGVTETPAMTVALLIALAGSVGLMAWIVRRLEKAS
jgi:hypothetical protein